MSPAARKSQHRVSLAALDQVKPKAKVSQRTSDFTRLKFLWLDQILADHSLPAGAFNVAYALATKYLNAKTLECWPAQTTLASDVGVGERQVRNLLLKLVAHGHLSVRRAGKGASNHYRPTIHDRKDNSGLGDELTGNEMHDDRQDIAGLTGNIFPPNPITEPCDEHPAVGRGNVHRDISGQGARTQCAPSRYVIDETVDVPDIGPCQIEKISHDEQSLIVRSETDGATYRVLIAATGQLLVDAELHDFDED